MAVLSLIVLLSIIVFVSLEVESRKSGPYTMNFGQIECCNDTGTNEIAWTNISKQENGNYRLDYYYKKPMDLNFKICIEGRELTSEGYTKLHQFNCNTCGQFWSIMGDFHSKLMVASGLKPEMCGMPVGNFTANNWNASQPLKFLPRMTYNKFKFYCTYYIDDVKVGCNILNIAFVPPSD